MVRTGKTEIQMIYNLGKDKHAFKFLKKAQQLLEIQDRIFEELPVHVYGSGCYIISKFIEERFGFKMVLVGLLTPFGYLTPHFVNVTAQGNLIDLKQRVSALGGDTLPKEELMRLRCGWVGVDILPIGSMGPSDTRTRTHYRFDASPSDFDVNRKETFKQFRAMLKYLEKLVPGKLISPSSEEYLEKLRNNL